MCSLFGWLDYQGIMPHRILRKLTQALANAAEERGTDASGISYVRNGEVVIYKRPKPAHKLHFTPPEGTRAVMGHTRMTTQGNEKYNYNNHPFAGFAGDTSFAFAHNDVLWNDKELRKDKLIPDTHIETDSYAACQLIEAQQKLDFESLRYMSETVEGNFTFTVLDQENSLYIIKGSNPMCLLHFPVLGLYVYASTESIIKKALKQVGLHKFAMERVDTDEGDILRIDKNGKISRSEFEFKKYHSKYSGWYNYDDSPYYNIHEEMLLAYCGCYGVDSEDVELLLEYGYACDEIEEMLMDTNMLHEALTKFGVPEQNIIIDKASGKDTEREGYQYLKRQILRKGDTLVNERVFNTTSEDFKLILASCYFRRIRLTLSFPTARTIFKTSRCLYKNNTPFYYGKMP